MKTVVKHMLRGIRIVLALVLLWSISRLFAPGNDFPEMLSPNAATGMETPVLTSSESDPDPTEISSDMVQENMFGRPKGTDEVIKTPQASAISAPELFSKKSGTELIGIVSGSPAMARAVFLDKDTNVSTIRKLGEKIKGATVKEISDDVVVVTYEGRDETLHLTSASPKASDQPTAPVAKDRSTRTAVPVEQPNPYSERVGYVERLLSTAQFTPRLVGDQVDGIRISGLDKIPEAKDFGFQEGDIIRIVNGQLLTSKQKAFQVFKKARSQSAIDMELIRNGKVKAVSFRLR